MWMCAAVAGSVMLATLRTKQTRPSPGVTLIVAVPVPSGSPGPGLSAAPVIVVESGRPPRIAVMTLLGQPPGGAGMMSAPCRWCAARDVPATVICRYGCFADLVRWQIVILAEVLVGPAFAEVPVGSA
jgi:hypothetical protein